jgi:hypothetical protein
MAKFETRAFDDLRGEKYEEVVQKDLKEGELERFSRRVPIAHGQG